MTCYCCMLYRERIKKRNLRRTGLYKFFKDEEFRESEELKTHFIHWTSVLLAIFSKDIKANFREPISAKDGFTTCLSL